MVHNMDIFRERISVVGSVISCIVSRKNLPLDELQGDYESITGEKMPYLKMGYRTLETFLASIPDVHVFKNNYGEKCLTIKNNPRVLHIQSLVSRQKDVVPRNKYKSRLEPYERWNTKGENRMKAFKPIKTKSRTYSEFPDITSNRHPHSQQIIQDPERTEICITEPRIGGRQLIGDDFFLQLVIRELPNASLWRKSWHTDPAIRSGLCISGQSIREAIKNLGEIEATSNRLCICLGSVDVYQNRTVEQMIHDYSNLLCMLKTKFQMSKSAVTLCTLPPLANMGVTSHSHQISSLHAFNAWIREIAKKKWLCEDQYGIIDLFESSVRPYTFNIDYDKFQIEARMVSGVRYPYVLWNRNGRNDVMKLLKGEKSTISCFWDSYLEDQTEDT